MLVADSSTHVEPIVKSRLGIAEGLEHLLWAHHGLLDPALHSLHLGMLKDMRQPLVREPDRPALMVYQNLHAAPARSTCKVEGRMTFVLPAACTTRPPSPRRVPRGNRRSCRGSRPPSPRRPASRRA